MFGKGHLFYFVCAFLFTSCLDYKGNGDLVGHPRSEGWQSVVPYGMVHIPAGSFSMGSANIFSNDLVSPTRQVTVSDFYMDETEITNSEYRQFVMWVADSITRQKLGEKVKELGMDVTDSSGDNDISAYKFIPLNPEASVFDKYMIDNYADKIDFDRINWDVPLLDITESPDENYAMVLDSMLLPVEEALGDERKIDVSKLNYGYYKYDLQQLSSSRGLERSEYKKRIDINVYPDTLVWLTDFTYSYNEPMHDDYFSHVAYDDYPVVGVSWGQANAFCNWRTTFKNNSQRANGLPKVSIFRLPTEAEWEYAARGGIHDGVYPWGGSETKDEEGCFLANFKPMRGDYISDGSIYTVRADEYLPNAYNLYNMAGNVSEWTSSSYKEMSYKFTSTLNPYYNDNNEFRKVVRGGSWKDIAYFLNVGIRDFEYRDSARSYIGFRTVQLKLGR
ncbi:T9SS ring complex lipoprotein PorK/GldK [Ichthyobacterium seriolicida]|nr:gliding motility lipoprotein GldK [Ichthyobacterium seriolicida]